MDLLKHLNLSQKLAVLHGKGPQLILGGAGTGKTLVISNRIAHLILDREIPPPNIVAVTISDMAANEMTKQVRKLLGAVELPLITTFQTLCCCILRRDINDLGFQSNFGIYDENDSKLLLKAVITEIGLDEKLFPVEDVALRIHEFKYHGLFPEDINAVTTYHAKIVQIYGAYQERLNNCNFLDSGDLLLHAVRLLTRFVDVRLYYQKLFLWIHVDNYEDITPVQYQLIRLLLDDQKNLCAAGDDDQALDAYSLGADMRIIYDFEKDFLDNTVVRLEQNYRTTVTIQTAANEVIKKNLDQRDKLLLADNPILEKIHYVQVETDLDEARFITRETEQHLRNGGKLTDIAVFYRTNAQSRVIEDTLIEDGIPYNMVGGLRFYERMEIKYILAYLRVLDNPADEVSLKSIINFPAKGSNNTTEGSFYEAVHNAARPRAKVAAFAAMMKRFRTLTYSISLLELVRTIMVESGYLDYLKASRDEDSADQLANLKELLEAVKEFCIQHPNAGHSEFLEIVSSVSNLEQRNNVTLMNLHEAKGLEFRTVFMIGMEECLLPHVSSFDDVDDIEEERRLCYIGMTRAREQLYLLTAKQRCLSGQIHSNLPSRFLDDISPELLDSVIYGGTGIAPEKKLNTSKIENDFILSPCTACNTQNRIPIGKDPAMFTCGSCHLPLKQDLPTPDSDSSQDVNFKGTRLNYLYFRRSIKAPSEIISALSDEQLYLRVHGKSITESPFFVLMVPQIRQSAGNDNLMLLKCLDGRALTPLEIDEKRKEGYVSNAEQRLFHMLKALADTNWNIYHQVEVDGILNPIDIVAVTSNFQIYAIELDGPHHLIGKQRENDDRRDEYLLTHGYNVIRVGYDKYALSCSQAAQEILLVLRGQVIPENTWRPDVCVNHDESNNVMDSKHPDFYRNRPQVDPTGNCDPSVGVPSRHCYIYCQSTGIDEKSQVVDFCLLVEEGSDRKQYYSKIKPGCPIESKATTLHGINDSDIKDSHSLQSYLDKHSLKQLLEDGNSLVITYDWDFTGRIMKNTAPRYLNWQNINLYSVVDTIRLKHGLKPISTISEAIAALGISPTKYKRYDSKDYARLVCEMFLIVTSNKRK